MKEECRAAEQETVQDHQDLNTTTPRALSEPQSPLLQKEGSAVSKRPGFMGTCTILLDRVGL